MKELTEKQEAVLAFITEIIKENGLPPTIRQIGEKFGITAKGAYDHLKAIEKKGFIKTLKNQSRAIELLRNTPQSSLPARVLSIPLVGMVAAGTPILAEENIEDYIPIPDELSSRGVTYALRVRGDSMVEAGINDGDIAIILKKETAKNGDIVVALVEDEATLKAFYKDNENIRLEARNQKYKPLKVKDVKILGKLIGIYRIY